MTSDSTFPTGQIFVREFQTLTDAHVFASAVSTTARLIDVSPTAGGAWVCGWISKSEKAPASVELIEVDASFMNALLSLGPKPSTQSTHIGIVEGDSIHEVFKSAAAYAKTTATLLEIRVKRAGAFKGAYAFFALETARAPAVPDFNQNSALLKMTAIPLKGDYKRYFL